MASTISHCRLIVAKPDYAARRRRERVARIARARRNLAQRSLSSEGSTRTSSSTHDRAYLAFAAALALAVLCHVGVAFAAFCSAPSLAATPNKLVKVQLRTIPLPAPVPAATSPVVRESAPLPAPAPRPRAPMEKVKPLAPSVPPAAPVQEAIAPPIAIVGLTLESTSSASQGPVFAVGQTLSGTTERSAATARAAGPNAPVTAEAAPLPSSRNGRAVTRAKAGVHVQPAQRLAHVQPEYPPLLERQSIEADVTVRVQIAANGQLLRAELVRGAEQTAFNDAALAAARKERFSPETHDGSAVETSLTYTYRFRITP